MVVLAVFGLCTCSASVVVDSVGSDHDRDDGDCAVGFERLRLDDHPRSAAARHDEDDSAGGTLA